MSASLHALGTRDRHIDAALMRRAQADDATAFKQLYERHAVHALRIARSVCGNTDRAEEAVQEGFLTIWRGRARFRPEMGSFRAWSMSIVRHAAIDVLRYESAAKRPVISNDDVDQAQPGPDSAADTAVAHNETTALRAALAELPAAQAQVIDLAFFGELTHAEIASRLGLAPGTVKGRIRLGLRQLRRRIV